MDIRTQKTLDEMTDSAVLAMALDEMEFLGSSIGSRMTTKSPPLARVVKHMPSDRQAAA